VCGTPFFPHLLVHLIPLDMAVGQRGAVGPLQGVGLELVPQGQQVGAVELQLAGQPGGRLPLGEPAEDQDQHPGLQPGAGQGGPGEEVEDRAAPLAAVVQHRGAAAAVDPHLAVAAAGAAEAAGLDLFGQPGIAGVFVEQVGDREVHGGLRGGR
jgi:hypothetical protein